MFKIFYSWQKKVSESRCFIQDCIKSALRACNLADDVLDRDTKGKTGAPNITQTILSKIDECSLFIADITIVNELTPNPNVLFELGYAVNALHDWERIICLFDINYGKIEDLPFDLRQQRITTFNSKTKTDAERITKIIKGTIQKLSEKPVHHSNKAFHIIGTYDFSLKQIDVKLVPLDLTTRAKNYIDANIKQAQTLIKDIQAIQLPKRDTHEGETPEQKKIREQIEQWEYSLSENTKAVDYDFSLQDREAIKKLARKYPQLSEEIIFSDEFFSLGNLKEDKGPYYVNNDLDEWDNKTSRNKLGNHDEKRKYKKIIELWKLLKSMQLFEQYLSSLDDILFFPLAIKNISSETDKNIKISISVTKGDPIIPDSDFIIPTINTSQIVMDLLFKMPTSNAITYENNNPLNRYIETPTNGNEYSFLVQSLRAGEMKWLGGLIAVKKTEYLKVKYSIISDNSDGTIEKELDYTVPFERPAR